MNQLVIIRSTGLLVLAQIFTSGVLAQAPMAPGAPMMVPGGPGIEAPAPGAGEAPGTEPVALATSAQASAADDDVDDIRDPFWPIGWAPSKNQATHEQETEAETPAPVALQVQWPELIMKGRVLAPDGSYWARIDNVGWVKTGDTVAMKHDGYIFKWKINKVTDEAISVKKLEASPVQK